MQPLASVMWRFEASLAKIPQLSKLALKLTANTVQRSKGLVQFFLERAHCDKIYIETKLNIFHVTSVVYQK